MELGIQEPPQFAEAYPPKVPEHGISEGHFFLAAAPDESLQEAVSSIL